MPKTSFVVRPSLHHPVEDDARIEISIDPIAIRWAADHAREDGNAPPIALSRNSIDQLVDYPIEPVSAIMLQWVETGDRLQSVVHVKPLIGELAEIVPTAELIVPGNPASLL